MWLAYSSATRTTWTTRDASSTAKGSRWVPTLTTEAKRYGIPFIETSAKNAVNVETVFHQLGQLIMDKVKNDPGKMKSTQNRIRPPVPPGTKPIENNTCCC